MANRFSINAATIATITAVAAIVLGIIDSRQTRAHNRLSVAPYLVVDYSLSAQPGQSTFLVYASNEGVGPAIIDSVIVTLPDALGGGSYTRWNEVAELMRSRGAKVPNYWNYRSGEALGVQRSRDLFRVVVADSLREPLLPQLSEIRVRIRYQSIYRQSFEAGLNR
jgi:hypothetical protein